MSSRRSVRSVPRLLRRVGRAARTTARPLGRAVTYTRWLHLLLGAAFAVVSGFVLPGYTDMTWTTWLQAVLIPTVPAAAIGLIPLMRRVEGLQAQLMLFPGPHARGGGRTARAPRISAAPSASWAERARTSLWVVVRLEAGCLTATLSLLCLPQFISLVAVAGGGSADEGAPLLWEPEGRWRALLLLPVPLVVLFGGVIVLGAGVAAAAGRLLGPSPAQRLAELEERTERLLERSRIAHELHDSIGHALSVAVVQAGAARTAGDPGFTERALAAIEETGRAALEDLERVLLILREPERPASARPALTEAERLLASARAAGAPVDASVTGAVDRLPGPVSRECYRMLQESLTNVVRHAGPVPVRVRIAVLDDRVELEVVNPLPAGDGGGSLGERGGSGLRGIRERAALLGGRAETGPVGGEWRVGARLPLRGPAGDRATGSVAGTGPPAPSGRPRWFGGGGGPVG
ncbi:histidine kinase [Streptomyces sp. NPDC002490]|uniref:sensor histidine kinase n=1 Tax=Streptomyces sp. NPDC002490 TaxID=3154416 RepID=UPI0033287DA8